MQRPVRPAPFIAPPFWRWKVSFDLSTPCEPWDGAVNWRGYAVASYGRLAHRVVYAAQVGPIPPGLTVDHGCHNTLCVNPGHLRLMTLSENSSDQLSKYWTECMRGHPFDKANTYVREDGQRQCRECNRVRRARSRAAAKIAA